MKLFNKTAKEYGTYYDHTAVLKLKDGAYKVLHIQDGCDNLDADDHKEGFTWYIDYEIKDFEQYPTEEERGFEDGYGGELLCRDNFTEEYPTWESLIEAIADMENIISEDIEEATLYYWR